MEDLQAQIDDINSTLDEISSSFDDIQNNFQEYSSNQDDTNNDFEARIIELEGSQGQLQFPLSQDSIDLIKEQFPSGLVALVAGTATVNDQRVSTTSAIFLSVPVVGGTMGHLSYVASAGQFIITSSSNTDTSTIAYLILN